MRRALNLGTRIKATGYLERYRTAPEYEGQGFDCRIVSEPDHGAWGWKRRRLRFHGVFIGYRTLGITWWHDAAYCTAEGDVRETGDARTVAHLRVYLVAYSTTAKPRYVLPRDTEVQPMSGETFRVGDTVRLIGYTEKTGHTVGEVTYVYRGSPSGVQVRFGNGTYHDFLVTELRRCERTGLGS